MKPLCCAYSWWGGSDINIVTNWFQLTSVFGLFIQSQVVPFEWKGSSHQGCIKFCFIAKELESRLKFIFSLTWFALLCSYTSISQFLSFFSRRRLKNSKLQNKLHYIKCDRWFMFVLVGVAAFRTIVTHPPSAENMCLLHTCGYHFS